MYKKNFNVPKKIVLLITMIVLSLSLLSCGNTSKDSNLADRTIMYYMIGSDLEERSLTSTRIIADICEFSFPNNMNLIMMTGGSTNKNLENARHKEKYKTTYQKYFNIDWETNQILKFKNGFEIIEKDFGKDDMTKEKTLEKFISYIKKNYPAKEYDIIFSDHGGAGLYGFGSDTRYDDGKGCLSVKDLVNAFKNTNIHFNTVGFDACLMASFELICALEPYSDYLIAAEETSFGSWDYTFLDKVAKKVNIDPVEYGKAIVDAFMEHNSSYANSLGLFSLKGFNAAVDKNLSEFSKNMNEYLTEDVSLESLYDILNYTMGLGYISLGDIKDLKDFLSFIYSSESPEISKDLKDSAENLWYSIEPFILYYKTHKKKYDEGDEITCGINFVFPNEDVHYETDDSDSAMVSLNNYPESLNNNFRLMYRLAFLRKALIKELKENTYELDDKKIEDILNKMCDRGIEKYKIPKEYIDNIRENVIPDLSANRIKSGEGGNFDFVKNTENNIVSFDYILGNELSWMIYEPIAIARTYGYDGKVFKLGSANLPSKEEIVGDKTIWTITPEEDKWFSISFDDEEKLVDFEITDANRKLSDATNLNYLFDKSISGFIPAVLRRLKSDVDEDNLIQILVDFDGNNKEGEIIGFTRYDQNSNMSAKDLESFEVGDKIVLIANFDDFRITKDISYLYEDEIPINNIKVIRGNISFQNVYFQYNVQDIYGEVYDCNVANIFSFKLNDDSDMYLYASFPSTWTDVVYNKEDSTFESISVAGQEVEKLKIDVFDVTNDTIHFGTLTDENDFAESTITYLKSDSAFNEIYDVAEGMISNGSDKYLPMLNIIGSNKNDDYLTKKYVYFEMNDRKYLIELSSTVDGSGNYSSRHDMRLIKTALDLVSNASPYDEWVISQTIEERPIIK